MDPRPSCPGPGTGSERSTTRKMCGLVTRGGSLDIPRVMRPGGQILESPSSVQKRFSEPQVKSEIKPPHDHHCQASRHTMSSKTSLRQEFSSVSKIERKSNEARSTYKHAGLKVRSDDAVPTFTQKLTLAHRRRLGMAKQWSMDETQSWFRQEIVSSQIKLGLMLKLSF
jgi:hypothetical protein